MRAIIYERYGQPEKVMKLAEVPISEPTGSQVRIQIAATTINDYDWSAIRGKPYAYRAFFGLRKPKRKIAGMELAGIVDATGPESKKWKVGDEVYSDISDFGFGSFAEYICLDENAFHTKPANLNFEEAVTLPHASLLALQALQRLGKIKEGYDVLINGGGGGVGTFGLQLAKHYNCKVTGVDTGPKLKSMEELGFDEVIDFKKQNFTNSGKKYDLVLDCKSGMHPLSYLSALKPNGKYVTVGGKPGILMSLLFWGKIVNLFSSKKLKILAHKANQGIETITQLSEQGKIKGIIDGPYPFEEIPRLVSYFGEGKHYGKVVVKI